MKKGKTILAAAALGVLSSMTWLAFHHKHPEQSKALIAASPATPDPLVALTNPVPARRMAARKAVRTPAATAEAQTGSSAGTRPREVPLPSGWSGQFTKQDLHAQTRDCDIDRPCSPRGRDGVLLMGASFALSGLRPEMPQSLSVGSYERRTPLLVYK